MYLGISRSGTALVCIRCTVDPKIFWRVNRMRRFASLCSTTHSLRLLDMFLDVPPISVRKKVYDPAMFT
uniref:AlNc14C252G9657 protein n=1 Tax=Albugo laibachii Nc14 TaxID=890382 RepID=F0WTH7_9STRA|nr:AlNc14C252G9657 [Albugo laibachii Nc14]|eukprot:CCA24668.1 AlNc14C252G9657 [Albugo laibachii Nc14]